MAAMGKRKIKNEQATGTSHSTRAMSERPLVIPLRYTSGLERLNVVVTPTSRLNISATVTVGGSTPGATIMREGFVTETGLLLST
jgi:hypothetical protein